MSEDAWCFTTGLVSIQVYSGGVKDPDYKLMVLLIKGSDNSNQLLQSIHFGSITDLVQTMRIRVDDLLMTVMYDISVFFVNNKKVA